MLARTANWLPRNDTARGVRSPHFWVITSLIVLSALLYYVDQTPLVNIWPFNQSLFTGVHDLHRTLFFIPIVYAALIFRVRGSIISSFVFLCVVLPRALLFSPYPDPLLRPFLFVTLATFISLLVATQLNRIEYERKINAELSAAYQQLEKYHKQLKESQEQLIQAEKLASLGQMAASIAHEVNNPLAGILAYTQLLIRKIAADDIHKDVALNYLLKIEKETTHGSKIIRNLLDFARQSPPTLNEVNLNDIVNRAFELVAHSAKLNNVQVIKNLTLPCPSLWLTLANFNKSSLILF